MLLHTPPRTGAQRSSPCLGRECRSESLIFLPADGSVSSSCANTVHLHLIFILTVFLNLLKIVGVLKTNIPLPSHLDRDNVFREK